MRNKIIYFERIYMIKKIFNAPVSYKERISKFEKIDTFIALLIILLYFFAVGISGIIVRYVSQNQITLIGGLINLTFVGIVLLVIKVRHQTIASIGLREGNIKLSLIMGIILAFFLFFCNCLSNIWFENQSFISFKEILIYLIYFLTVGLAEEVLFRGYLETRLHAVTGKVFVDVIIAGILFVLMHFPFRMVAYSLSFFDLIMNVQYMGDLFLTHLILSYIRIKSDSLYGAIIPHWISDLAYRIVTHFS